MMAYEQVCMSKCVPSSMDALIVGSSYCIVVNDGILTANGGQIA